MTDKEKIFDLSSRGYGLFKRVTDFLTSDMSKDEFLSSIAEWQSCDPSTFTQVEDPR